MKKYALNNSYFKNRTANDPDTLSEIVSYFKENGELPFRYDGNNWPYDTVCERQKREHIIRCQHLTPDDTARKMAILASHYSSNKITTLDACCGTGQITGALLNEGFNVSAFDIDTDLIAVHNLLYPGCMAQVEDFTEMKDHIKWELIVSNPPFDAQIGIQFFVWLEKSLLPKGKAVLLLPKGFVDKTRPKALVDNLNKFNVLHREDMTEKFFHTAIQAEIIVLKKIRQNL
jgi:SAM-dependent methyltransferase